MRKGNSDDEGSKSEDAQWENSNQGKADEGDDGAWRRAREAVIRGLEAIAKALRQMTEDNRGKEDGIGGPARRARREELRRVRRGAMGPHSLREEDEEQISP